MTRYPAIFVDDVLVATPNDFGFYGRGEKEEGGRYAPLKSAAAHQRFRADLKRMIELVASGRKLAGALKFQGVDLDNDDQVAQIRTELKPNLDKLGADASYGEPAFLAETIASVVGQTFTAWQLTISENGPGSDHVRAIVEAELRRLGVRNGQDQAGHAARRQRLFEVPGGLLVGRAGEGRQARDACPCLRRFALRPRCPGSPPMRQARRPWTR